MDLDVLTGLSSGQRLLLFTRCSELLIDVTKAGGRPAAIGTYKSIMLVVCLMRKNITQETAGAVFGVSQSTVSRRWDLLRPIIKRAVASFVPHPREVLGGDTVLVDGTITPTWNWKHVPDLFSGKADYAGMDLRPWPRPSGDPHHQVCPAPKGVRFPHTKQVFLVEGHFLDLAGEHNRSQAVPGVTASTAKQAGPERLASSSRSAHSSSPGRQAGRTGRAGSRPAHRQDEVRAAPVQVPGVVTLGVHHASTDHHVEARTCSASCLLTLVLCADPRCSGLSAAHRRGIAHRTYT